MTWRKPVKHRVVPEAFRASCVVKPRRCGDTHDAGVDARCMLAVKPVGEPDAGNPHVRFDERGGETDCTLAAPRLSSTLPSFAIFVLNLASLPRLSVASSCILGSSPRTDRDMMR